jgi:hypothetical protein
MSANEIRELLLSYLVNEIPIDAFEDQIAQRTWDIQRAGDEQAKSLAYAIEAKLGEFSGGHIDESALRQELSPLVTNYTPELTVEWASIVHAPKPSNVMMEFPVAVFGPPDASLAMELSSKP